MFFQLQFIRIQVRFNPSQVQFTRKLLTARSYGNAVSIPHRFNSHSDWCGVFEGPAFRFNPSQVQFTPKFLESKPQLEVKFQSLTGSIHTYLNHLSIPLTFSRFNPSQVQFTPIVIPNKWFHLFVSIPHRFNSHFDFGNRKYLADICFNPSQVQFTLWWANWCRGAQDVSIPHRFNSHFYMSLVRKVISTVSIPHRFNSHWCCNKFNQGR